LSFVAWIAKAHEGSVRVESTPGRGSRFIVFLPVSAPAYNPDDIPVPSGMNEL